MNLISTNSQFFDIGKVIPLQGYFLLEYTPDDGRGCIAHVDKIPLIGFAFALVENKFGMFPLTPRGLYIYEDNKLPTILCPCGGVCSGGDEDHDVFMDNLADFMQAKAMLHSMGWKD